MPILGQCNIKGFVHDLPKLFYKIKKVIILFLFHNLFLTSSASTMPHPFILQSVDSYCTLSGGTGEAFGRAHVASRNPCQACLDFQHPITGVRPPPVPRQITNLAH